MAADVCTPMPLLTLVSPTLVLPSGAVACVEAGLATVSLTMSALSAGCIRDEFRKEYSRMGTSECTHFSKSKRWSKGQWKGRGC